MDVSIIIPTYNRLWALPRAIASCRNAKCTTEIIVVDDGSTDGTWEWLQTQSDVIAIRQENQGQTYAINKGFSVATGQYIRFLDSDDYLCTGIIDIQYDKAIETKALLICGRVDVFHQDTNEITVSPDINHWTDFMLIQIGSSYGSHFLGMLFERSLVEQVPRRPDFAMREDRMFLLEIALLNPQLAVTECCAGYWVKHPQQMQANYQGLKAQVVNWQHLNIYKIILGKLEAKGKLQPNYKQAACTILWPLAHWIAKTNITEANLVVKWIYELDPDFQISGKGLINSLYRTIGFVQTEKLLRIRRYIKNLTKAS